MHPEETGGMNEDRAPDKILNQITAKRFNEWYRARQYRQNIREGKQYFNGPRSVPAPHRHSPSSLFQCHRKMLYRQTNAPEEKEDPEGILWVGSQIEEKVVVPFLQDVVATDSTYVRNSMWIDFTVDTDVGNLRIKGVTDPVIVDESSTPLLPTEVNTLLHAQN